MSTPFDDTGRRTRRRRLLLLGLLPLLLALGFAGKVGAMLLLDRDGRSSYDQGHYDEARGSFAANTTLNVIEPWIAPYDEGTARYREDDFPGAVEALEMALLDVTPEEECRVRVNLALAHEAVGDAAADGGRPQEARSAWQTGIAVLAEGGCLSAPGSADAARAVETRAVDTRLREKLRLVRDADRPGAEPEDPAATAQQDRLDHRNDLGEQERDQTEQQQEDRQDHRSDEPLPPAPTEDPSPTSDDPPPPVYEW